MLMPMAEIRWRPGLILVSLLVPGGSLFLLSVLLSKHLTKQKWTGRLSPLVGGG